MNFKSLIELIVWNHHTIMPWLGYVAALLLAGLGPLWLIWAMRRSWRALRKVVARGFWWPQQFEQKLSSQQRDYPLGEEAGPATLLSDGFKKK